MTNSAQLLIIGNGFDLHCGLKSSYKDFLQSAIIDSQGVQFGLKQLKAGVSGFWESLLLEYYKVNGDQNYNWCDVESIIKKTLGIIVGENNTVYPIWIMAIDGAHKEKIGSNYSPFNDGITKYIFDYCVNFYVKLTQQGETREEGLKPQKLLANILQELHNFEKRFCKYLRDNIIDKQGKGLNTAYILNAVNLLAQLTNFSNVLFNNYDLLTTQEIREKIVYKTEYQTNTQWTNVKVLNKEFNKLKNVYILSFNYTALFDILFVESPCIYSNVHGKLCNNACESCRSSSIIFGIDDSVIHSQTDNSVLRIFSKTYRKMLDTTAPTKILPENNVPVTIKFYGHSLSEADYSYFQSIFDYYNLYGNNKVDLVFCYSKGYEQTDAIYRLINTYGKTLNNQEQGKNLIHKLLLENRLMIQEIE